MRASWLIALVASAAVVVAAIEVRAGDFTVHQKDKKFDVTELTIKKGQTITFENDDPFTHNVYSETPGMEFDLRTQAPGKSSDVTFDHVGTAEVLCAIHPQMKLKVTVTE